MNHPKVQIIFRTLLVLLLSVIGLFFLYHFLRLTYPFLIAALFALLINPVVIFLEKRTKFPRPLAVLTSIVFVFVILGGAITLIVKWITEGILYLSEFIPSQIVVISSNVQTYFNEYVLPLWDQGIGFLNLFEPSQQQALEEGIQMIGSNAATLFGNIGQAIGGGITRFIGALPITFIIIVFTILAVYFISKDFKVYLDIYKEKVPVGFRRRVKDVIIDLRIKIFGFLKSQIILMSLTAVISLIGLLILRVENAITIAFILGVLDLIPYFGPGLVLIPWSVYAIATGDLFMGVGLLILYASTVIVRQFSEPKILSSSMKLNPLAILFSLFAGIQLFGVIGLAVGPISLVLILSLYDAKVFEGLWGFIKGNNEQNAAK